MLKGLISYCIAMNLSHLVLQVKGGRLFFYWQKKFLHMFYNLLRDIILSEQKFSKDFIPFVISVVFLRALRDVRYNDIIFQLQGNFFVCAVTLLEEIIHLKHFHETSVNLCAQCFFINYTMKPISISDFEFHYCTEKVVLRNGNNYLTIELSKVFESLQNGSVRQTERVNSNSKN